jgi:hypothetical protein
MTFLRTAWQLWKRIALIIGDFIARIVLTIFYFTLFVPFGLGVRLLSDPLGIKHRPEQNWLERSAQEDTFEGARRLS